MYACNPTKIARLAFFGLGHEHLCQWLHDGDGRDFHIAALIVFGVTSTVTCSELPLGEWTSMSSCKRARDWSSCTEASCQRPAQVCAEIKERREDGNLSEVRGTARAAAILHVQCPFTPSFIEVNLGSCPCCDSSFVVVLSGRSSAVT